MTRGQRKKIAGALRRRRTFFRDLRHYLKMGGEEDIPEIEPMATEISESVPEEPVPHARPSRLGRFIAAGSTVAVAALAILIWRPWNPARIEAPTPKPVEQEWKTSARVAEVQLEDAIRTVWKDAFPRDSLEFSERCQGVLKTLGEAGPHFEALCHSRPNAVGSGDLGDGSSLDQAVRPGTPMTDWAASGRGASS